LETTEKRKIVKVNQRLGAACKLGYDYHGYQGAGRREGETKHVKEVCIGTEHGGVAKK